ncbi:MAG: hypothetical protein ACQERB_04980 [Promethearchaeati archaeon]
MKFIIEGNYDIGLLDKIKEEDLPISHIILHVPKNPIGNSSIFLPKDQPSFKEFENYTNAVQESGFIPIAGLDSTCQGNLEAHMQHYEATKNLLNSLENLNYRNILVSAPNNVGFIKENYSEVNIFLSYSQYVTSTNRAKIFFDIGVDSIILHPDINRSFGALRNFIKMKEKKTNSYEFVIPLNIGCNWGCIYWYQHHNLQSHRTINSPISNEQINISDIENSFDYPILNCWKNRLKSPQNILKSGWISPYNFSEYINLGYETFYLSSYKMSNDCIINTLKSYLEANIDDNFLELISIPYPYGEYWNDEYKLSSFFKFDSDLIKEFCKKIPYEEHYPKENKMISYCNEFSKRIKIKDQELREKVLDIINHKLNEIEKGSIKR